jgi:hypothetical protein
MSDRNLEGLSERERACLAHVEEAKRLGVNFSRYCREKDLSMHQWSWVKRVLVRKGVIGGRRRRGEGSKAAGFVGVRIAPAAVAAATPATVCRIRHPSGWTIECGSFPDISWMSALMSGAAA